MSSLLSARPKRRLGLYLPFVLLGLIAVGWSGLWLYAQNRVGGEVESFIQRERERGRVWACPERQITGYPFRIEIRCRQPTYTQTLPDGQQVIGSLGGLRTIARAYDPRHIVMELEGPLSAREPNGGVTETRWQTARASVRISPGRLDRFSFESKQPVVEIRRRGFDAITLGADRLEAHLRPAPQASGSYDIALNAGKARIALLDQWLQTNEPLDLILDATAERVERLNPRDWRATLDSWREDGGTLQIKALRLTKGVARLQATGTLRLDDERRPAGQLDAELVNAGDILRQFGIGGPTVGLLGAVLGGGERNRQMTGGQPQERVLRVPVTIERGTIRIGPVPVGRVGPLY